MDALFTTTNKAADKYNEEASAVLRKHGAESHEYMADEYGLLDWAGILAICSGSWNFLLVAMSGASPMILPGITRILHLEQQFHFCIQQTPSRKNSIVPLCVQMIGGHTFTEYRISSLRKGAPIIPAVKGEIIQIG